MAGPNRQLGEYLAIIKKDNGQDTTVFLRSASLDGEGNPVFPMKQSIAGVGAVSKALLEVKEFQSANCMPHCLEFVCKRPHVVKLVSSACCEANMIGYHLVAHIETANCTNCLDRVREYMWEYTMQAEKIGAFL